MHHDNRPAGSSHERRGRALLALLGAAATVAAAVVAGSAVPASANDSHGNSSLHSQSGAHSQSSVHSQKTSHSSKGTAHSQSSSTRGNSANAHEHVTICHATPPDTAAGGYVMISPSAAGVYNGHLREHSADIIPPFTYSGQTYSLNWDTTGQAIWNNGCAVPTTQAGAAAVEGAAHGKGAGHGKNSAHSKGAAHTNGAAHSQGNSANAQGHVTICHATPPDTAANGYVMISPSASGVYHGHLRQHAADIIPPFDYAGQTFSLNWDTTGQAIFANGCAVPTTASVAAAQVAAAAKTVAGAVLAAVRSTSSKSAGVKSGATVKSGGVKGARKTLAGVTHRARPAHAVTRAATFTG